MNPGSGAVAPSDKVASAGVVLTGAFGSFGSFLLALVAIGFALGAAGPVACLGAWGIVVSLLYWAGGRTDSSARELAYRNLLIGLNAAANAVVGAVLVGPAMGSLLAGMNLLAASPRVASSTGYQSVLSWLSWLSPMSWPTIVAGIGIFVIDAALAVVTLNLWGWTRIERIRWRWADGTLWITGGALTQFRGGYNMGPVSFIHRRDGGDRSLMAHEFGHALNLAALGSCFHFIGAIDENWLRKNPMHAYAERLADTRAGAKRLAEGARPSAFWA